MHRTCITPYGVPLLFKLSASETRKATDVGVGLLRLQHQEERHQMGRGGGGRGELFSFFSVVNKQSPEAQQQLCQIYIQSGDKPSQFVCL